MVKVFFPSAAATTERARGGTRGEMVSLLRGLVAVWFSLLCPFNGGLVFSRQKTTALLPTP